MHQKVHEVANLIESDMSKHVSSNLMEHMQKIEEEVRAETKKFLKIMEDCQTKISASHFMEH